MSTTTAQLEWRENPFGGFNYVYLYANGVKQMCMDYTIEYLDPPKKNKYKVDGQFVETEAEARQIILNKYANSKTS